MPSALIAGMGIQGVAIYHGMHVLGYDVSGVDISEENLSSAKGTLTSLGTPVNLTNSNILDSTLIEDTVPDVLVCALPFHLNYPIAEKCIRNGIRYCDLGGNIDTSDKIRALAEKSATVPVTTDLGLAPGIANNFAEVGYHKIDNADTVKIRVGGLPANPKGTLKYGMTFNPQGLYNEYREDCIVFRDGKKLTIESLSDIEDIEFDGMPPLVAFNTSGGIANLLDSMMERGVRNCDYKTIRFPGHVELIRFMLFECGMDLDCFSRAIENSCGFITDDQVLISIEVLNSETSEKWSLKSIVMHDETFTAMQKTTGFGAACVAAVLGSGAMDHKKYAEYIDVPIDDFIANIRKLLPGIDI